MREKKEERKMLLPILSWKRFARDSRKKEGGKERKDRSAFSGSWWTYLPAAATGGRGGGRGRSIFCLILLENKYFRQRGKKEKKKKEERKEIDFTRGKKGEAICRSNWTSDRKKRKKREGDGVRTPSEGDSSKKKKEKGGGGINSPGTIGLPAVNSSTWQAFF